MSAADKRLCECGGLRDRHAARCWSCQWPARTPLLTERGYEVPLTRGMVALVDESDLPLISGHLWSVSDHDSLTYASCRTAGRLVYMHHLILQVPVGLQVDHVNRDGLDNRRSNLRAATPAQNIRNQAPRAGSSKFKGVSWSKESRCWKAFIRGDGGHRALGRFSSEVLAALAYDRAAIALHGEFAVTNESVFGPLEELVA